MNPLTEQQLDAEVSRYEPKSFTPTGRIGWRLQPNFVMTPRRPYWLPPAVFGLLLYGDKLSASICDYPTREAAFADLRQAIRLSGSAAAQ